MTRMTPSEAFVETMVANGVTTTFGIMGSAFMDAMDIFAPAGIELVPVVHEQGAAHMADGYARVSGKHGVVIGQNGPGISNCVTAVAAAFWAHSPVVMITPETGTMGQGLGGFQEANQLPMFQEFVKYQGHIANENRMAEITARCFDRAMSEIGPTQLNIRATASTVTSMSRFLRRWFSTAVRAARPASMLPPPCSPRPSSPSSSAAVAW
jgi:sulfoacetaldehyde acetyltransferase